MKIKYNIKAVNPKPYPNCSTITEPVITARFCGCANARKTYTKLGRFMAATIGSIHFFRPCRATTSPPKIPPTVKAIIPAVLYTDANWISLNSSPPFSTLSSINKGAIFTSWASPNLKIRINRMEIQIDSLLKKAMNVSLNPLKICFVECVL